MNKFSCSLTCFAGMAFTALPAHACSPIAPEPMLEGEGADAYAARINAQDRQRRERQERQEEERQPLALREATSIFLASEAPPKFIEREAVKSPTSRSGQPGPPPMPRRLEPQDFYNYSYYQPIAWFKGVQSRAIFRVARTHSTCGPSSLGDTDFGEPGALYVFFARKGSNPGDMIFDAIAVDRITHPALTEFVAKHRKNPIAAATAGIDEAGLAVEKR